MGPHACDGPCARFAYGGLGWLTFKHFYRVHIAGPLGELASAAGRIAGQDLDFSIERVRGKELVACLRRWRI